MSDGYRVLVVENDEDPTMFLRLVLLKTDVEPDSDRPVRCPARVQAMIKGIDSTVNGAAHVRSANPMLTALIMEAVPARREVLTAFFRHAGCTAIAIAGAEGAASLPSTVVPDLLVLPETSGIRACEGNTLMARYPSSVVAVTSVLT